MIFDAFSNSNCFIRKTLVNLEIFVYVIYINYVQIVLPDFIHLHTKNQV